MIASPLCQRRRGGQFIWNAAAFLLVITMTLFSVDAASSTFASDNPASETYILTLVEGHVKDFMSAPIEAIGRAQAFLRAGGFPALSNGASLGSSFANPTIESKWAFMETPIRLYFGREDGGFLIYPRLNTKPEINYAWREVGNPGYEIEPFVSAENQKHFSSCLDEKGNTVNCTLPENSSYIRCIDDCEMELCNAGNQNAQQETGNATEADNIWCQKYSIKTVQPGEKLGGIPMYFSCIDEFGAPTQTQGKVLLNLTDKELGNCYYQDGKTLVNGTGDTVGVYRTRHYDPRYRGWYISSKEGQRPLWSDPYIFFSLGEIGITYTEPIYIKPEGTTKKVFDGAFAVDYSLEQIDNFLYDQFYRSDFLVAVVEASEPHYVVALSTGSKVTYSVYNEDTSKPCPEQDISNVDLCKLVRIPIENLGDMNQSPGDRILSRAFEEESMASFPPGLVAFQESDDMGANAWISQSSIFEQESANLKWHVIVVVPMERSERDAVRAGTQMFDTILATSILGWFFCMALCYLFFRYRHNRKIQNADYRFTCAFLFGNGLVNLSSLANLGENTDELCMFRMWAFDLTFVIALSPLYVKIWRIYSLLKASRQFRRIKITNVRAILYTLPIISIEIIILTVFSFADPPKAVENLGEEGNLQFGQLQSITCQHETNVFHIVQIVFDFLLISVGCFLAFKSRNIDPRFGEARQLGFVMYNTAFMGILLIILAYFFSTNDATFKIVETIAVAWWTITNSLIFVVPWMMGIRDRERKDAGKKRRLSNYKFVPDGNSEILVTTTGTSTMVSSKTGISPHTRASNSTAPGSSTQSSTRSSTQSSTRSRKSNLSFIRGTELPTIESENREAESSKDDMDDETEGDDEENNNELPNDLELAEADVSQSNALEGNHQEIVPQNSDSEVASNAAAVAAPLRQQQDPSSIELDFTMNHEVSGVDPASIELFHPRISINESSEQMW